MEKSFTVALAGNPNSGKTTIFNNLTGVRQKVGNYPGVTVEKKEGICKFRGHVLHVVDLPGTYSLTAYSLEEVIARNFVVDEKPDVVVDIVDASNLERNLYLALQFLELGAPLVIALNMYDVAKSRGMDIDVKRLSELLKVPIVPTVGNKRQGMDKLLEAIVDMARYKEKFNGKRISYGRELDEEIARISQVISEKASIPEKYPLHWLSLKLLENDNQIKRLLGVDGINREITDALDASIHHLKKIYGDDPEELIIDGRYGYINGVYRETVRITSTKDRLTISDRIDKVVCNRFLALPIFLLIMYIVFQAVYSWSSIPTDWINGFFGWLGETVGGLLPEGILKSLLNGIIGGVGAVLVFLPQILTLFLFISFLEDTGYMARAAFIMDGIMAKFGLHGKAFIPLLSSFACAVPGIMATRTIKNYRNRMLTMLVAPFMSCSARLPIYTLLIAAFIPKRPILGGWGNTQGLTLFAIYLLGIIMAWLMVILFKSTILKGERPPFVMELPPYRLPTIRCVIIHMWERGRLYVKKAGTIILAAAILMWALFTFPSNPRLEGNYEAQREQVSMAFEAETGITMKAFEAHDTFQAILAKVMGINHDFEAKIKKMGWGEGSSQFISAQKEKEIALAAIQKQYPIEYPIVERYLALQNELIRIDNTRDAERISKSFAGHIGRVIEPILKPLGFDWRLSIALVSGFAAKEVFVSTMGQIYALGEVQGEESLSLVESVRNDPLFTPLLAVTIMVFALLSSPCMATIAIVKQESNSWKWPLFMIIYTNSLAWIVSFMVYQGGKLLGFT